MPTITTAGSRPAGPEDVRSKLAFLHQSIIAGAARSGGHDAGAAMRQFANWTPPLRSVDSDTLGDIDNSKARARDLARNDPFAANAARIDRDSVVGPGLRLSLKPDHVLLGIDAAKAREWARMVERRWEVYANSTGHHADARRMQSFNQLTRTMESSLFHDGEALATVIWRKPKRGQSAGTCFQLVSTDRLSNPYWLFDNPKLRKGIERNRWGEPVAYFIREAHPSDGEFGEWEKTVRWRRIRRQSPEGRRNVIHVFDHKHAEMTRGITDFTSTIKAMKMRGHYADATLERAIIQAFFAATIKTNLNYDQAMQVMGASFGSKVREAKNPMTAMTIDHVRQAGEYHKAANHSFGGAATMHLLPNEDIELHRSENADGNFEKFEKSVLRQIAAGTGTPITALSQNYSDVNYSAARSALQDVWRHYMSKRDMLVRGWMWPAVDAWLEEEVISGEIDLPDGISDFYAARDALLKGQFYGWGKPMIDPVKERKAQQIGLQMGVETLESICAEQGLNWEDVVDQRVLEVEYMAEKGLDPWEVNSDLLFSEPDADSDNKSKKDSK